MLFIVRTLLHKIPPNMWINITQNTIPDWVFKGDKIFDPDNNLDCDPDNFAPC